MLDYNLVKTLHILFAFMLVGFATASLLNKSTLPSTIGFGIGSIGVMICGLGLIGILKLGMPPWIHVKLTIWLVIMMAVGIVNKRFPKWKMHTLVGLYALTAIAIYLAVYKPF